MEKVRIAVICGGESVEHEISLASAKNVFALIDRSMYEPSLIGITKKGNWWYLNAPLMAQIQEKRKLFALDDTDELFVKEVNFHEFSKHFDVAFPVLHGSMGEDGSIQGFFKILHIPCVGPTILDAAIGMDKEVLKRLCQQAGIPVAPFLVLNENSLKSYEECAKKLGPILFIKPSCGGSSVGISKVEHKQQFNQALEIAFSYDHKVLVEKAIICREIEVSVLGNQDPIASLPGEVIPHHDFYSYEAKYMDEHGASFSLPAQISEELAAKVRELALKVYKVGCCRGMARVDFFLDKEGEFYFNEINSIPGFTSISLYPKLWEISGLEPTRLVSQLIQLAIENNRPKLSQLVSAQESL